MRVAERYSGVVEWFKQNMPVAESELHYQNPYELLVAVILSAQCTDKRVNIVTPPFFERYPSSEQLAEASEQEIFEYIKSISYPNNKARNLAAMGRMLWNDFGGVVPDNVDDLQKLPGVGRKTANVVASVVYNVEVMPVDTHVFRVAERIGLTTGSRSPLKTEQTLTAHIESSLLPIAHHWLILHGRYVCVARKPKCAECGVAPWCRFFERESKKGLKVGKKVNG